MKIVIYGINQETLHIADCVGGAGNKIIAITDSFADIDAYGPYKFIKKEILNEILFDYIVVAVYYRRTYEEIRRYLVNSLGIPDNKIISFDGLFAEQRGDQMMLRARVNRIRYSGIILGISHAAKGINPQYLRGNWCNLAVSSEDIYYHEKVFEKCCNEYKDVIQDLKHVIIDLYDYTVFGYDISKSKAYLGYLESQGYAEDTHNFDKNVNYKDHNIEELLKDYKGIGIWSSLDAIKNRELRKQLFDEEKVYKFYEKDIFPGHTFNQFKEFYHAGAINEVMNAEPELPFHLFYKHSINTETVKENKESLHRLVRQIRSLGNNIKITFMLLPRYYMVEEYHKKLLVEHKQIFDEIIRQFLAEYDIQFIDCKECTKISRNNHFFSDPAHLNSVGAVAFTTMLNNII